MSRMENDLKMVEENTSKFEKSIECINWCFRTIYKNWKMSRQNIKEIYKIGKGLYPKEGLGQEEILLLEVEIWLLDS